MRRVLGAFAGAIIIAAMATGGALASHAIPGDDVAPASNSHMKVDGNPSCGTAPAGGFNLKIEDGDIVAGKTYGNIRITAYDGKSIDWEIVNTNLHDANTVIVKGGPNAIVYQYSASDRNPPDDSDTNLTAPRNFNGGGQPKYYGISHVQFCFDPKA